MSVLICLDPGHGGTDRGSIGFSSLEKDVCLDLAYRIERKLLRYEGIDVTMTRSFDLNTSWGERTNWANQQNADLFLSLHINASPDESMSGFSSYVSVLAGSQTRRIQCWLHNKLTYFLRRLHVPDLGKKNDTESFTGSLQSLAQVKMPAVALGTLFITNRRDHALLNDNNFLDQYTNCVAEALASIYQCPKKKERAIPAFYNYLC